MSGMNPDHPQYGVDNGPFKGDDEEEPKLAPLSLTFTYFTASSGVCMAANCLADATKGVWLEGSMMDTHGFELCKPHWNLFTEAIRRLNHEGGSQ